MTSNNQAYYEFPNGAVSGDITLKAKMKWDGNGDGAGIFLVDTTSSGFGNGAWGNQDMAGAFWANQGWTYDRSYEDSVGWGTLSADTCHGQHQISSGTWKWVKYEKTDDQIVFSWYDADTFAEADRFCSTTNTFTNPDRWDSIDAITFSTTGYYAPYGTHDYGFDDIEITCLLYTSDAADE